MTRAEQLLRAAGWETLKEGIYRLNVHPATILGWAKRRLVPRAHLNKRVVYFYLLDPPKLHPNKAKLTPAQVEVIRMHQGYCRGSQIARLFKVSCWTVYAIWEGRSWISQKAISTPLACPARQNPSELVR